MHVAVVVIITWLLTGNNLANTIDLVTAIVAVAKGLPHAQQISIPGPPDGGSGSHEGRLWWSASQGRQGVQQGR